MAATDKTWADGVPPQVNAVDLNGFKNENNNLIASTGLPVTPGDNAQTAEAVSDYAAGGGYFYQDSGAADSYILNAIGSRIQPKGYFTGMHVAFMPQNSNTGPSTVKVGILGTIPLLSASGTPLIAEALAVGEYAKAFYDGSNFILIEHGTGSDFREQLASQVPGDDGALRVGLYDPNTGIGETIHDRFVRLSSKVFGADGAASIGLNDHTGQTDVNTFVNTQLPKDLQSSFALYGDDVGVADAIAVTLVPAYTTYVPGTRVYVKVANDNLTNSPTLNLNGLGFKSILNTDGSSLLLNVLKSGGVYEFVFDGVAFQLMNNLTERSVQFSQVGTKDITTLGFQSIFGTLVGNNTFPANFLRPGSFYRLIVGCVVDLPSGNSLSIEVNGIQLSQITLGTVSGLRNGELIIDFIFSSVGAPSTLNVTSRFQVFDTAPPGGGVQAYETRVVNSADFDSTIPNVIGVELSLASTGGSIIWRTEYVSILQMYR